MVSEGMSRTDAGNDQQPSPFYLSSSDLRDAVKRLGASRAIETLNEFLILKRVTVITAAQRRDKPPDAPIIVTESNPHLIQAIDEFMVCFPEALAANPASSDFKDKLFNPMAYQRDSSAHGYKKRTDYYSKRFTSGLRKNPLAAVVAVREDMKPTAFVWRDITPTGLSGLLLKEPQRAKPRIIDIAMWYFRGQDITTLVGSTSTRDSIESELVTAFRSAINLTNLEVDTLFETNAELQQHETQHLLAP